MKNSLILLMLIILSTSLLLGCSPTEHKNTEKDKDPELVRLEKEYFDLIGEDVIEQFLPPNYGSKEYYQFEIQKYKTKKKLMKDIKKLISKENLTIREKQLLMFYFILDEIQGLPTKR